MRSVTAVSKRLGKVDMVVDKLHFRNRVDRWYKGNCNPHDRNKLYAASVCLSLCPSVYRYRIAFVLFLLFLFLFYFCFFLFFFLWGGGGGQKYIMTVKEMGQIAA